MACDAARTRIKLKGWGGGYIKFLWVCIYPEANA